MAEKKKDRTPSRATLIKRAIGKVITASENLDRIQCAKRDAVTKFDERIQKAVGEVSAARADYHDLTGEDCPL